MKAVFYVVAAVGLLAAGLGVYWDIIKHDHPTRGLVALIAGVVLLIIGLAASFIVKPKAQAA
jgi:sulfite exporter TauE/SafE